MELSNTQYEEFPPALGYECRLVPLAQSHEGGDRLSPPDAHEEDPGRYLTQGIWGCGHRGNDSHVCRVLW